MRSVILFNKRICMYVCERSLTTAVASVPVVDYIQHTRLCCPRRYVAIALTDGSEQLNSPLQSLNASLSITLIIIIISSSFIRHNKASNIKLMKQTVGKTYQAHRALTVAFN